jgi:ubiquinone/menaquinone biosynthesis C-methylase UbiE
MLRLTGLFERPLRLSEGVYHLPERDAEYENQLQTNEAFSNKWGAYSEEDVSEQERLFEFQRRWYLKLYGFESESALADYLKRKSVVLDAGCGLGYKAKWFADLSPSSIVLGMDYSDSVYLAAERYKSTNNLVFVKGDIADTRIADNAVDYVSCDQVIMHTEKPEDTFRELVRILKPDCDLAVYVYAKKALPRELLDQHFRTKSKYISHEEMMEFSKQLTELGEKLSSLKVSIDAPDIPLLGIKGGRIDIQRFIYWNFIKCFWNEELGHATSVATNYDWYSPSNAKRYSEEEFMAMVVSNNLNEIYFHTEDACHSGRFRKECAE